MSGTPGLRVDVTGDRLRAYATVCAGGDGVVAPAALAAELARRGVSFGVALETVGRLAGGAAQLPEGTRVLVAEGKPAVQGTDGRVEFIVDISSRPRYRENSDGSINFHETNLVQTVKAGDPLAVMHPPTQGVPGKTVFGETIAAKNGQPAKLRGGPNTEISADGLQLLAKLAGRVNYDGDKLSIEPVLKVKGDVDFSVGNIRFPGVVEIGGNVLDGFEIHAGQSLEIHGVAGACVLKCGGDITIGGGVNGRGKAVVEAGGTVRSKYFNDATVRAGGDIEAGAGILNSQIRSLGAVHVKHGAFIGGELVARAGLCTQDLGSALGVTTKVTVGKDYIVLTESETLSARARVIDADMPALVKRLEALADRKKFLAMPEAEREKIKAEYETFKTLKAERVQIEEKLKALVGRSHSTVANPRVTVAGRLYPGVLLCGTQVCMNNNQEHIGPLVVAEDLAADKLVVRRGN